MQEHNRGRGVEGAVAALREARRLVVFTGAGVSTESGIPDFRSPGGLWTRFKPADFYYEKFLADPVKYWRLRAQLMRELALDGVRPNAAHEAIARAEASGRLLGVITQNIDGLHGRAGTSPQRLVEVHGSALRVRCVACARFFAYEVARASVEADRLPPACPACGGVLKPGTVLFGEGLPEDALAQAEAWARTCDALLVVGSSLEVYPAALLPRVALDRGARLVIVNRDPTPLDEEAHAVVRAAAGAEVPRLLREAGFFE